MRVITGTARGRRLVSAEGMDVRPTTDKVKESLFSIIQFELEGRSVLDLFAGSGQLGIEAISRGAERAVFVDSNKKSVEIIKQNISLVHFEKESSVVFSDSFSYLASAREKFDIVILDPPYNKQLCDKAFPLLPGVLKETSVVICETQSDELLPEKVASLEIDREYKYSSVKLTVYRKPVRTEVE